MFFSKSKDFLFIHIPKTAGTSLKLAFRPYGIDDPLTISADPELSRFLENRPRHLVERGMAFPNHLGVRSVARLTKLDLETLTIMSVVRDPWRRMQSLYRHIRRDKRHPYNAIAAGQALKGFVGHLLKRRQDRPYVDTLPQMDYLVDQSGRVGVDVILKQDSLEDGLHLLCRDLQISLELPRANASPEHQDAPDAIDSETQDMIADYEAGIIRLLGYQPGGRDGPFASKVLFRTNRKQGRQKTASADFPGVD
ncbi:MAG: sulfotransferase family 2 domain-containing protein [Pseudomonadota bacterium]